jgi:hypothetical protein
MVETAVTAILFSLLLLHVYRPDVSQFHCSQRLLYVQPRPFWPEELFCAATFDILADIGGPIIY